MIGNSVRNKHALCPAHNFRRDVISNRENKHEDRPRPDAGYRLWEIDPPKSGCVRCAKRFGSPNITGRDRLHHGIHRQDHEGQKNMSHCNDGPDLIIYHHQSGAIRDQADLNQNIVYHPCCCNITFQADVRTSSEVQKGSNTSIIKRFACRMGILARSHATG